MSAEANDSASNAQHVFVYIGPISVVPRDVTRVRIHPSVRIIAARALGGCVELVEVELCEGLEEIEEDAFLYSKSLKRITLPSTVRVIGRQAFVLSGLVVMGLCEGLEEIGERAFNSCRSLKGITIPSSLSVMGDFAFGECDGLVEVELCEGLEVIG